MNWSGWLNATPQEQEAMRQRYRDEVKRDQEVSRAQSYRGIDAAVRMPAAEIERRRALLRQEAAE